MDDNLIKAIVAGNVMLFLGAGFSKPALFMKLVHKQRRRAVYPL